MATERAYFAVGLTGGIGSGKSLVADQLELAGAAVVDADRLAHQVTAPAGAAIASIRARFGAAMIAPDGALDRAAMRSLAFSDAAAKRELEAIVHPLVRQAALDQARSKTESGAPYVVFAIPLLIESGDWLRRVDRVLLVDCPAHEQVRRVMHRSALAAAQVQSIIAQQASRSRRLAAAQDVLFNGGSLNLVSARVARLHATYLALATGSAVRGAR
ncbi:MAG: dephospho-CoA kinase [Betaproteobacteria bacterium]